MRYCVNGFGVNIPSVAVLSSSIPRYSSINNNNMVCNVIYLQIDNASQKKNRFKYNSISLPVTENLTVIGNQKYLVGKFKSVLLWRHFSFVV